MSTADEWANGYARQAWADFETREKLRNIDAVPECHKFMTAHDRANDRTPGREPEPEHRRWRRLVAGVAVFALLSGLGIVVLCLWVSAGSDTDRPPPIPNPNGYDDLLQAAQALKQVMPVENGNPADYAQFETPALKNLVARIHDPLVRIRQGLERPFQVPYVYDMDQFTESTMRDVGQIKVFVNRALQAEGLLARRENLLADEARSALDLVRVGNSLGRDVPAGVYLSSLPSISLGAAALRDMRDRLVDDPDLCRRIIAEMARLDRDQPPIDRVIERESAFMNTTVRSYGVFTATMIRLSGVLAKQNARALKGLREASKRSQAIRRLVLADLAVRLYQKEHRGAPPTGLEVLVPTILPRMPIDPFTDRPLVYRATEHGYQLYSTGPDRDDDQLNPILKQLGRNDSDGDATVESF